MQKASDLEGSLDGQRAMMNDTHVALQESRQREGGFRQKIADQEKEFQKCSEELQAKLETGNRAAAEEIHRLEAAVDEEAQNCSFLMARLAKLEELMAKGTNNG